MLYFKYPAGRKANMEELELNPAREIYDYALALIERSNRRFMNIIIMLIVGWMSTALVLGILIVWVLLLNLW